MSACTVNALNSKFNLFSKVHRNDPPAEPKKPSFHWTVESNLEDAYKSHKTSGILWKTAAYVSAFAYGILSTAACITTSILFGPVYAPFAALGAISFMGVAGECFTALQNKANTCFEMMREERFAADKVAELKNLDSSKLEFVLRSLNVSVYSVMKNNQITDVHTLTPLIGRYEYWKAMEQNLLKEAEEIQNDPASSPAMIRRNRLDAFARKESAHEAKVKAAFYLLLLRNPSFKGDLDSICGLYMPCFTDRQLGVVYEKKNTPDPFVIFNNKKGVIGIEELEEMSISDLAAKLYDAAPKPVQIQ